MSFLSTHTVLMTILGYKLSYIECIGVVSGFIGLYLATQEKVANWLFNIVSIIAYSIIFYQVHLYSQMLFQVYFFLIAIFGWFSWRKQETQHSSVMCFLSNKERLLMLLTVIVLTSLLSILIMRLPFWLPSIFKMPDAYPLADSFVSVGSLVAYTLLMKKKVENWLLWIVVDSVSVILFVLQGIYFAALQYIFYTLLVSYGYMSWCRKMKWGQVNETQPLVID